MAALNSWQRIDRVLSGKPFGDGRDGDATISSDPNSRATASGTAGSKALTIGSAILSNGDIFLAIQYRGTGYGQWEINKVASGGGTTSVTCDQDLHYTYGTGAQVIKIPFYNNATINNHSLTAWDRSIHGIEVIAAKTSITVSGTLTASAKGHLGGTQQLSGGNDTGSCQQGDGYSGDGGESHLANGSGGGGGGHQSGTANAYSGAGGGHASAGTGGYGSNGGNSCGAADATTIQPGGGGGCGRGPCAGGNGGGIVILISKTITVSGSIANDGAAGVSASSDYSQAGGGGGAGGAILLICGDAVLGTNKLTVGAGGGGSAAANGSSAGGAGSVGRIAVHHSGTVTGSTTPALTDVSDATIKELGATGNFIPFFM